MSCVFACSIAFPKADQHGRWVRGLERRQALADRSVGEADLQATEVELRNDRYGVHPPAGGRAGLGRFDPGRYRAQAEVGNHRVPLGDVLAGIDDGAAVEVAAPLVVSLVLAPRARCAVAVRAPCGGAAGDRPARDVAVRRRRVARPHLGDAGGAAAARAARSPVARARAGEPRAGHRGAAARRPDAGPARGRAAARGAAAGRAEGVGAVRVRRTSQLRRGCTRTREGSAAGGRGGGGCSRGAVCSTSGARAPARYRASATSARCP